MWQFTAHLVFTHLLTSAPYDLMALYKYVYYYNYYNCFVINVGKHLLTGKKHVQTLNVLDEG